MTRSAGSTKEIVLARREVGHCTVSFPSQRYCNPSHLDTGVCFLGDIEMDGTHLDEEIPVDVDESPKYCPTFQP